MLIPYKTIKGYGECRFEVNRSIYIGYIDRAESEEKAVAFISQVKKINRDANHNCSAYIIGKHSEAQKADDDGEPSGTAGKPILEVLKKQGLTDTVIVVTRYFGGIKLGAGGLIRAYGKAASEAVRVAATIERQPRLRIAVTCEYALVAILENNMRNDGYAIVDKTFADRATLYVLVQSNAIHFEQRVADWSAGTASIQLMDEEYADVDHTTKEPVQRR